MKKFCFLFLCLLVGCATITKGSKQSVAITSNVDGATIYLDGEKVGTTPYNGLLSKNKEELRIEKEGYRNTTIILSKSLEGMFWANIIIGGTLGSSTDFATGAAYAYMPATYHVELKAETSSSEDFNQRLKVRKFAMVYIDDISKDLGNGQGESLSTLISYMGLEDSPEIVTSKIGNALNEAKGDQVQFGRKIIELM